jgi:hypothetical protein
MQMLLWYFLTSYSLWKNAPKFWKTIFAAQFFCAAIPDEADVRLALADLYRARRG